MPRHRYNCTVVALLSVTVTADTKAHARLAARAHARDLTKDDELFDANGNQFSIDIKDAPNQLITLEQINA